MRLVDYGFQGKTSMHSSRMRTGHSLTVCRRSASRGGGVLSPRGLYLVPGGGCT